MAKIIPTTEQFVDLGFPVFGIDVSGPFWKQRSKTCPSGINVRAFDPTTNRSRGGNRAGLVKYYSTQPNGSNHIQELALMVGTGYSPPGGSVQTSTSGRVVTLVAVSAGNVYVAAAGGTAWVTPTNNTGATPPLVNSGALFSAANQQKLYFADGANYRYYDPATNTVENWVATSGTLPISGTDTPRLIMTWRGRTVVAGITDDPQNWFMSAVGDPGDWMYLPEETSVSQAVAGNNSPLGLIGDVVTCLIPYSDDVAVVGGDHTIYLFNGDPMAGGQIDLVSDSIGMAWGMPWCKSPDGILYFVSNRTSVYAMQMGGKPERISQSIEPLLQQIDTGAYAIRCLWNDVFQGLHVFITKTSGASATTHYFWEQRTNAWWQDEFGNVNHDPITCTIFDGNEPGDRVALLGSWDGYVRAIDPTATTDDVYPISSEVTIGPLTSPGLDDLMLKELKAVFGEDSEDVTFSVFVGETAEAALSSTAVVTGTWRAGRNLNNLVRRSGHAIYVKISSTKSWAMEAIRAKMTSKGKVRAR